jgi:Lipocalin-like domain
MRRLVSIISFVCALILLVAPVQALGLQDVIGTWRIVSSVRVDAETGTASDNLSPRPEGFLILTPDSRFMIIEVAAGRAASDTVEGLAALQKTMLAYTGVFTASPDPGGLKIVNHIEVSSNQVWTGTDQVRFLSLDGNRLTITTPTIPNAFTGKPAITRAIWERSR